MLSTVSAENKECLLSGDINCNYLVSSDHKEIKSILTYFGLKQLISSPMRITRESKTLIDVICSNVPHNIFAVKVIPTGLSDHELLGCARKLNNVRFNPRIITCRNFANYNPKLFCEELNSANLEDVYSFISVNEAWPSLRDTLQRCINKHAPLISKKVKGRLCPWLTPDVKKEMNHGDGLLRKARWTNQEIDWSSYKRQRNRVYATEYLALLKNVKADIIEISLKIVPTLQINFGQPSRNSILLSYPLNKVRRLW